MSRTLVRFPAATTAALAVAALIAIGPGNATTAEAVALRDCTGSADQHWSMPERVSPLGGDYEGPAFGYYEGPAFG